MSHEFLHLTLIRSLAPLYHFSHRMHYAFTMHVFNHLMCTLNSMRQLAFTCNFAEFPSFLSFFLSLSLAFALVLSINFIDTFSNWKFKHILRSALISTRCVGIDELRKWWKMALLLRIEANKWWIKTLFDCVRMDFNNMV